MSSAERPEADVAEQSRSVDAGEETDRPSGTVNLDTDREAADADLVEQQQDAGLPDEDDIRG